MTAKEPTPAQKALRQRIASLSGRIAANRRAAAPGYDGKAATAPAKTAYWGKLMAEVDPNEELPEDERLARAKRLWQVRMDEGKLKRARNALRKAG